MRSDKSLYSKGNYLGWHFTSAGGIEEVRRKLNNSYSEDSYNTPQVQELLEERFIRNEDYLGRNFVFKLEESEHPEWLKENRDKFEPLYKKI